MTYDKEKLLKMLSAAPIYEGIKFYEEKNNEFLDCMDDDFFNYYDYAHGATKFVLIPVSNEEDYVIKIPYTGLYGCESGYYSNSIYHSGRKKYYEYCEAEDNKRPWDYCACEVNRYYIAMKNGFSNCFAKTELLGYVNNYPIYIQEKCTSFNSYRSSHTYNKEEVLKTYNYCNNYYNINKYWLTDFRFYYGENMLLNFINFISNIGWDDDLSSENIGYIKDRPVLIDYSGFLD